MKYYKSAICKNGHLQDSHLEENETFLKKYCQQCSSEVIDKCSHCNKIILGSLDSISGLMAPYNIPNYCHGCGSPYPWTEKFLNEYKLILGLQSDEIDRKMQDKIYKATEEAIKQNFKGNSITILKFITKGLSRVTKEAILNSLKEVTTNQVIDLLN